MEIHCTLYNIYPTHGVWTVTEHHIIFVCTSFYYFFLLPLPLSLLIESDKKKRRRAIKCPPLPPPAPGINPKRNFSPSNAAAAAAPITHIFFFFFLLSLSTSSALPVQYYYVHSPPSLQVIALSDVSLLQQNFRIRIKLKRIANSSRRSNFLPSLQRSLFLRERDVSPSSPPS